MDFPLPKLGTVLAEAQRELEQGRGFLRLRGLPVEAYLVKPLEFDGRVDSIFHLFDADQRKHMEYVHERGSFANVPFAAITSTYKQYSPKLLGNNSGGDFGADAQLS